MAASTAIAATVISTAATVYATQNQPKAPSLPKTPTLPKLPETESMAGSAQQADIRARTAGGTILSNQRQNQQIGDGAGTVRKNLLGV